MAKDTPEEGMQKTTKKMSDDELIAAHNNNRDAIKDKKSEGKVPSEGQLAAKRVLDDEMKKRGLTRP